MRTRLLRRPEGEVRTGLSRSTIYTQMAHGEFPRPLRIGHRAVAWNEDDLEGWIAARTNILVFLFPVHVGNKKTTFSSTLLRGREWPLITSIPFQILYRSMDVLEHHSVF